MPLNSYFNNYSYAREQDLTEDLVIEAIKIYGFSMRYIPRTIVNEDEVFGEDYLSRFDQANELEMYIKNVEGFEGEGDFLSRFNLEIRDQITFTVARKRFDEAKTEKIVMENGWSLVLEDGSTTTPSRQYLSTAYTGQNYQLEDANGEGYTITTNRPTEGDLIYFPLMKKLFEIQFVEHEEVFYQTGRLQTYDIRCELFEYSSEKIATGNTDIDAIETRYSTDELFNEMLMETGDKLLNETGGSYILQYRIEDTQPTANNEVIQKQDPFYSADDIIDYSESNPFSEITRY